MEDRGNSRQGQPNSPNVDLAQALKDLTRGEQTATAMENKLSRLEQRIEELLASVGDTSSTANTNGHSDDGKPSGSGEGK